MFTKWINKADSFTEEDGRITIRAGEKTDYFCDPGSDYDAANSPFYVFEVENDFTFECKVKPQFNATYDGGLIMLYINDKKWVKFALENTDLGYPQAVSVVTNETSDDSMGEKIESDSIYLKISKKGNVVGLHFSEDAKSWKMVRIFKFVIENNETAYVGISSQSPAGDGCTCEFTDYKFNKTTVADMRKGV